MTTEGGTKRPNRSPESERDYAEAAEESTGVRIVDLAAIFALDSVKGLGPQKFKELHAAEITPSEALAAPGSLPFRGKRGESLRGAIAALDDEARELASARAVRQIARAADTGSRILTYGSSDYPVSVFESNYPVPVLYLRGATTALNTQHAVACVGSRSVRPPYDSAHRAFVQTAANAGFTIVSGFALGADTIGHKVAFERGAPTVAVMPCGLDRPFPPENRDLWAQFADHGDAAIVSDFPFGTGASALTLRRRNKLIVAFAQGVLVSQSSASGGAMNAYRFAKEQRKPIATFEADGEADTTGNAAIAIDRKSPNLLAPAGEATATILGLDETGWLEWLGSLSS